MAHVVLSKAHEIKLPWRDQVIELGRWADDAFGFYAYVAENGRLTLNYELSPDAGFVSIRVFRVNGRPARAGLLATTPAAEGFYLVTSNSLRPRTVPAALLALIVWAEHVSVGGG